MSGEVRAGCPGRCAGVGADPAVSKVSGWRDQPVRGCGCGRACARVWVRTRSWTKLAADVADLGVARVVAPERARCARDRGCSHCGTAWPAGF